MKRILFVLLTLSFCICSCAQETKNQAELDLPEVYRDDNIVFWKLDDHTWIGSGNRVSSETLYLIEGKDKAVLLDAGTHIPDLDKIVAGITKKPVSLLLTHGHGDHTGAAGCFDELWINNADASMLRKYKGKIHHIENGQKFDLGGRVLEAYYTPGHTAGSVTFLEVGTDKGYSGDAFGNTNLLIMTDLSTMIRTCKESVGYFKANGYERFYNGHFWGDNLETIQRIQDIQKIVEEVLAGTLEGEDTGSPRGLNRIVTRDGVRVNYNHEQAVEERSRASYVSISPEDLDENIFRLVGKDFTVITAGEDPNSMVASWGGVGIMFNKPVTWCFLRANRYTLEKIRETGTYTMCYFPDQYKGDIMQFGTRSGRNTDKMDQTKLTPFLTPDGYPAYKEARIIIECKLIAASTVSKDEFYTDEAKTFLQEGYDEAKDWHKLVYGEITNILIKK
jgi:glyoxylase-like metal-dependent hydrolase (beta-lactamase superfamily II)